ncbi:tail fiber domain-containing protein [Paracraurococcus lichenis]|uniref:Tail fiber domain-containing protein n=1 Tax=Paracraurococcus lichenis TaxID=3064888 RepID=A0ABT9E9N2_9PROT|nr:tail fiber domain-containing protein [Paracraurococcus sp. LOR1-02]MDO9712893.1 tail fiber domain-containing protein [Paracraurococcus sp. LOR1-02]
MSGSTLERPRFVEGQYIGAGDLDAIVAYHRARLAEHLLGGHSWGIVSGLALVERPDPAGGIEVWLQPGTALDGYGRGIVVRTAMRIPVDHLQGRPTGSYRVWIGAREEGQAALRPGYGGCACDADAFTRMAEGYELEFGELRLDEREGGVHYNGALSPDARLVRRLLDTGGPFLCDGSVPEQAPHPRGARARWLVPLGQVQWDEAMARLVALPTDDARRLSRRVRRNAGLVGESLLGADGLLRLRPRLVQPKKDAPDSEVQTVCDALALRDADLALVDGRPVFHEPVWIESNLRLVGNGRIWGGRWEFRKPDGTDDGRMLAVGAAANAVAPGPGRDLAVALGTQADGSNRLVVGVLAADGTVQPAIRLTSDGRIAIGTDAPQSAVHVEGGGPTQIHSGGTDGGLSFASRDAVSYTLAPNAGQRWLWYANGGKARLWSGSDKLVVTPEGRLGLGTATPQRAIHVEGDSPTEIHSGGMGGGLSFANRDTKSFVDVPAGGERWVWYALGGKARLWSGGDKLAVTPTGQLGIGTDAPRSDLKLEVRGQIGMLQAPARLYMLGSAIADDGDRILRITSGGDRVEIGAFGTQPLKLNIGGEFGRTDGPSWLHLYGSRIGDQGDGVLRIRSGGDYVAFDGNDRVGIGVALPSHTLHVQGTAYKSTGPNWLTPSDERLKKDVAPVEGALGKLLRLRGVRFAWRDPTTAGGYAGIETGLLAGEVEKVFPEWVETGPDGYKLLNIRGFEALVVEALRELQAANVSIHGFEALVVEALRELRAEHAALRERVEALVAEELRELRADNAVLRERVEALEHRAAGGDAGGPLASRPKRPRRASSPPGTAKR